MNSSPQQASPYPSILDLFDILSLLLSSRNDPLLASLHHSVLSLSPVDRVHLCADLHLGPNDPISGLELWGKSFIVGDHVVILGDLFEAWIENFWSYQKGYDIALDLFQSWHQRGCHLHLVMGNRDVLVGRQLLNHSGFNIYSNPLLLKSSTHSLLLLHGDELLPDDISYQRFKVFVRNPLIQVLLRCLPLCILLKLAGQTRRQSIQKTTRLPGDAFSPTAREITALLKLLSCNSILGGHLHKALDFVETLDGREIRTRILPQSHGYCIVPALFQQSQLTLLPPIEA